MRRKRTERSSFIFMLYPYAEVFASVVGEYIHEYLWLPAANWPEKEIRYRSYARWAAYELLEAIDCNPGQFCLPNDVLTWLDEQIDELESLSDGGDIFTAAIEAYRGIGAEFV